jgi:ribosomal protein L9
MKVTIVKPLRKKKLHDLVDVSFGYYKNFLAPNKIATLPSLKKEFIAPNVLEFDMKKIYESLIDFTLIFEEKGNDTGVLYSSINLKLILSKLNNHLFASGFKNFALYPHSLDLQNKIKSPGEFYVNVFLSEEFLPLPIKILVSVK